jgi:NAD(P)-dependent dehydrogenase (short-subunit alcohol dehydrogenase family)
VLSQERFKLKSLLPERSLQVCIHFLITLDHRLTRFLVTGGNRGIGLGIAECCLVNGAAKIYSIDLAEPAEEFAEVSKRFPGRLFAVTANVTKEASVTEAVDKILAEAGGLHGMVVNAGRTNHKSALDFTQEEIEGLFAVNVRDHAPSRIRRYSFHEVLRSS